MKGLYQLEWKVAARLGLIGVDESYKEAWVRRDGVVVYGEYLGWERFAEREDVEREAKLRGIEIDWGGDGEATS